MIAFFVPGKALPNAYKTVGMQIKKKDKNGRKAAWTDSIQWRAIKAIGSRDLITGPFSMTCCFFMKGNKKTRPKWFDITPDDDNLAYLISNALSGVVYRDDRQRVDLRVIKRVAHGIPPGVYIEIAALTEYPDDWGEINHRALLTIRAEERQGVNV